MGLVTAQMSVSLDGYYAGPRHAGPATDPAGWIGSPEALGFFRITRWAIGAMAWRERQGFQGGERNPSSDLIREAFDAAGAYVMGRRMADGGEVPWGDEPPFRAPVFVVTHRPRETLVKQGGTSFTYVTGGVESAVTAARAAAGGKDVAVAGGGTLLQQVLAAGLLDQLDLHVVPVLLGGGMRLFDPAALGVAAGAAAIELVPTQVIHTPEVTHLRYRVVGPAPLVTDDRGRGEVPAAG